MWIYLDYWWKLMLFFFFMACTSCVQNRGDLPATGCFWIWAALEMNIRTKNGRKRKNQRTNHLQPKGDIQQKRRTLTSTYEDYNYSQQPVALNCLTSEHASIYTVFPQKKLPIFVIKLPMFEVQIWCTTFVVILMHLHLGVLVPCLGWCHTKNPWMFHQQKPTV